MRLFYIVFILALLSCTTAVDREYKRVQTDEYYRDSGAAVYMLPILPEWRNFSGEGQCKRTSDMRYLNILNLMDSFSIDHQSASQIQFAFNRLYTERAQNMERSPTLKEVEQIFFSANDFVTATGGYLKQPKFSQVNIIWFDSYRDNMAQLKKLMSSKSMLEGRPVFVSLCLKDTEIKPALKEASVNFEGAYFVDYRYLTYYTPKGELSSEENFYLDQYLSSSVRRRRVYSHKKRPNFIKGRFKYINY
ncbi:hypothetical protein M902_2011 [Bacteriovorax sp. BAL6_X]|uniref:hypothetical protein n=1 Tax=Bacteriovorax sp. BAL6_X TaxID=1201290 RepID=UPI000386C30D|nr:hypothetical protein [Bacteriovorax sp. BAL6_X]EPZ52416.1 hypothetical protein M902_2011 [Bacteriovorax sp. BAL6_X]